MAATKSVEEGAITKLFCYVRAMLIKLVSHHDSQCRIQLA